MQFELLCHPATPARGVEAITVTVFGGRDDVLLTYVVRGYDRVLLPDWRAPRRADDLWRTTCFEVFLRAHDDEGYFEFNFSPSTEWSAYSFTSYREGLGNLVQDVDPFVERLDDGVEVDCDLGGLPGGDLKLALSAVIEETDGTKSYWALAHAPGPPDFHNPACFTATLPAVGRP